ncbi:hypothetical protein GCM10009119_26560 [Algoriphagus jejuensis]|uniref:Uncharacterized protein n=1 Tax=Algoriphagus jejuensis TaxID=419934 RepID=A0ABN1N1K0_9BACT
MKKALVVLVWLISHGAFAQIVNLDLNGVPARLTPYTDVDGSPYLFEDWSEATISTTNGGVKEGVAFRFNIHDNALEVVNEAGNTIVLDKDYVEYVVLQRPPALIVQSVTPGLLPNLLFKKSFEFIKGIKADDLINVLAEGEKYTLIRRFYSDLVTPAKNSYAPTAGSRFVFEETFYLINDNDVVSTVKAKTNVILKSLNPTDSEQGKRLVKDQKLDLRREDHLVIFFSELNKF